MIRCLYICSILFLLMAKNLKAQINIEDTVSLKVVQIKADKRVNSPSEHSLILDSSLLSHANNSTLGEIISQNTGIFVKSYGQGSLSSLAFRGSGASHTGIYWNGFSMNSAMNGQVDLSLLPPVFYDQIEIDFGNSSMKYGAGGLGGSLLLSTSADFNNKLTANINQNIGSFGQLGTFGKLAFGNVHWQSSTKIYRQTADNDFEYRNLGKEGFPMEKQQNADFEQLGILQGIYFRPTEDKIFQLEAWYMHTDRNIPSIMTVNYRGESQQDESIRLVGSFKNYYKKSTLELASNFQHEELFYEVKLLEQISNSSSNSWKNRINLQHELSPNVKFKGNLRLDMENIHSRAHKSSDERVRQASYFSATYSYSNFDFEIFGREEWLINNKIYFLPGFAMSGKMKDWLFRASIARNINYPTLNDLNWIPGGNPDLRAEQSENMDMSISNKNIEISKMLDAEFSLTAFYFDIQNYIQWQPTSFGYWRAENLKEIQSKGVEGMAQMNLRLAKTKLNVNAKYSYTHSINTKALQADDESVGKQLFYVPKHLFNSHIQLTKENAWLKFSYHYTGLRYTTSDNSEFLPAFSLFHLKVGKKMYVGGSCWSIEMTVKNFLDQRYQAILWRAMPGRSYLATVKYQFKR